MGHHSIIYGRICGPTWKTDDFYKLHQLNKQIIERLPEKDEKHPWINRSMFSIADEQGTYRDQLITFGASYKTLEWEWHEWIEKFESILKQLYWLDVKINTEFEVMGHYSYNWQTNYKQIEQNWYRENPIPITDWAFQSDGPRTFLEILNKE